MADQKINLQYTTLTVPLPDFIYDGLKEYVRNANGYRPQPQILIDRLAEKQHVEKDMIFLTAGADEAIQMFALAYGKKTYIFTPTYTVYNDTKDFFADVQQINVLKNNDYQISTDTIPDATLIYLANPNNPFGFTSKEKILTLVKNNPQAIIVIDEVYAEFADLSVIDQIKNFSNLVVLRSFSKSYGMAGNRIGYIVAQRHIIGKVKSKTQWSNVSYLSVGAAMIALDHESYFTDVINQLSNRRERYKTFLMERGYTVLPTYINAVLLKFFDEKQGTDFANYIEANNFVISHGNGNSNVGLDKSFVRISIGTEEEMRQIQSLIENYSPKVQLPA